MTDNNTYPIYKGLTLTKEEPEKVTDAEIQKAIDDLLSKEVSYETKEDKSVLGDIVNIDFEGFVDGVAFEGGKDEKYDLELGSNTFIPGFEDQLVGYKSGDEVDVKVTFPENYQSENLKGKDAIFKCKVNEVKIKKVAIFDNTFANKYGFDTTDALKEAVVHELEMNKKYEAENKYIKKICDYLVDNSNITLEDEKLNERMEVIISYFERSLSQYGMDFNTYMQMLNTDVETYKKEVLSKEAEKSLKIDMIYDYIAKEENIEVTDEDLEKEFSLIKDNYKVSDEQLEQFRKDRLEDVKSGLLREKVTKLLLAENN